MTARTARTARKAATPVTALVCAPQTKDECDAMIAAIGEDERTLAAIETAMNAELAAAKERHERRADIHRAMRDARAEAVEAWCEAHRAELTRNGAVKSYRFGSGEVSWRARPAKVLLVRRTKAETVIAWLDAAPAKFRKFLRIKAELNKEALLEAPELAAEVPGISIGSGGEAFEIKPFAAELEETA